jgi:hypothetical protein
MNSIRCVRTTLDIEAPVLAQLRQLQRREGGTLGALVSRLLTDALAGHGRPRPVPAFQWTSRPMRALVDLEDKDAVYAILDRPDRAAEP